MRVQFAIHFKTEWGQYMAVYGPHAELGGGDPSQAVALEYHGDGQWSGSVDIELATTAEVIQFRYVRCDPR